MERDNLIFTEKKMLQVFDNFMARFALFELFKKVWPLKRRTHTVEGSIIYWRSFSISQLPTVHRRLQDFLPPNSYSTFPYTNAFYTDRQPLMEKVIETPLCILRSFISIILSLLLRDKHKLSMTWVTYCLSTSFMTCFLSFLWGTILRLLSLGQGSVKYNLKS